jgi:hypothetical protein
MIYRISCGRDEDGQISINEKMSKTECQLPCLRMDLSDGLRSLRSRVEV